MDPPWRPPWSRLKMLKKAKKAAKEAEKLKRRQEKEARKQERARLKRERKEFAASHSKEFAEMNNIHNYFASSLKNMPSGTRNAFDVLGKKKVDKDERRKKRREEKKRREAEKQKLKLKIDFDEKGMFKVPIKLGKASLIKNLGTICLEKGYHGPGTIFPVGYAVCHAGLPSFKRPGKTCIFTTTIKRGVSGPMFEVTCSDDHEFKLNGKTASNVWSQLKAMWLELEDGQAQHNQKMADAILNHKSPETATSTATTSTAANVAGQNAGEKSPTKSATSSPGKKKSASVSGLRKIGLT